MHCIHVSEPEYKTGDLCPKSTLKEAVLGSSGVLLLLLKHFPGPLGLGPATLLPLCPSSPGAHTGKVQLGVLCLLRLKLHFSE